MHHRGRNLFGKKEAVNLTRQGQHHSVHGEQQVVGAWYIRQLVLGRRERQGPCAWRWGAAGRIGAHIASGSAFAREEEEDFGEKKLRGKGQSSAYIYAQMKPICQLLIDGEL